MDASSAEIQKLHEYILRLEHLTNSRAQELVRLSTELSRQKEASKKLENQQAATYRSHDALRKRLSRAVEKTASYKAHSSNTISDTTQRFLKGHDGVIKPETRDMLRRLACEGVSTERASEVIGIVAEGLGLEVVGSVSAHSIARIMYEGLIKARMQVAYELDQANYITICGDGTSIKNQQYEAKSAYIQLPETSTSLALQNVDGTPVHRTFGVQRAPTHTAKQQLNNWVNVFDVYDSLLARSPLGQTSNLTARGVAPKLRGMLTDHAADQKRLYELLREWKSRCDREARGAAKLKELSVEEQLRMLSDYLDSAASNVEGWRSLSPEKQGTIMHDAWFALAAQIGEEEFQKLSPDAKFDVEFLAWTGCCMHKELNAVKGGVTRMALAWEKLGITPPIPLLNMQESQQSKHSIQDRSKRGAIKLTNLMGAVLNNKDEKKGHHCTVNGFFQKELGYEKQFAHTILHLELYKKLMDFIGGGRKAKKFTNIEQNVFNGLHDIPTLTELVALALYAQVIGRPYMRYVRSGARNALDLGAFHCRVKEHCQLIIHNPDLLLAQDAVHTIATLDGECWDESQLILTAIRRSPELPNLRPILVAFFEGALETWERFTSEFAPNGVIAQSSAEQRKSAWVAPANDVSEGALGQCRQMLRRAPTMSDEQRNARVMWAHHGTYEWSKQMLTKADETFVRQEARRLDSSGANKALKEELHNALEERIASNMAEQARIQAKRLKNKERLIAVEVLENATYNQLQSMKIKDLDLQIDKLREEGDKIIRARSMIPNKQAKIKEILAALERRREFHTEQGALGASSLYTDDVTMDQTYEDEEGASFPEDSDMYFKDEVVF